MIQMNFSQSLEQELFWACLFWEPTRVQISAKHQGILGRKFLDQNLAQKMGSRIVSRLWPSRRTLRHALISRDPREILVPDPPAKACKIMDRGKYIPEGPLQRSSFPVPMAPTWNRFQNPQPTSTCSPEQFCQGSSGSPYGSYGGSPPFPLPHTCCSCVTQLDPWLNKGLNYLSNNLTNSIKTTIQRIVSQTTVETELGKGQDVRDRWYHGRPDDPPCPYKGLKVVSVERIQNPEVWNSYQTEKRRICGFQKKVESPIQFKTAVEFPLEPGIIPLDSELNEGYLFHAASYTSLLEIKQLGFDSKFTTQGMFGVGCYFTEDMTKADQYIDPKQEFIHVVMARVCMGNPFVTSEPRVGALRPDGWPRECQSTLTGPKKPDGETRRFREFIIPEGKQAYPEFVLTLKRIAWHKPEEEPLDSECANGHLFRIPFKRLKHLKMSQGQVARALNKNPQLTVFLSEGEDEIVLHIEHLFPDSILVKHNPQLQEFQQKNTKVEAHMQLGAHSVDTSLELSSFQTATVDRNLGISVPFQVSNLLILVLTSARINILKSPKIKTKMKNWPGLHQQLKKNTLKTSKNVSKNKKFSPG